ncbi:MAG: T9SS type A sorting domain-containing protein [Candidatus Delongbacteria bacterium]|nr:T9SS type A sorting domain-containing protein [Candidatus Delongbacteria bacterium]MBN2836730.1 T9SS type A sorting domain-containing protein [Candidatus Delongbacteria bacterium]
MKKLSLFLLLLIISAAYSGELKVKSVFGQPVNGMTETKDALIKSGILYLEDNNKTDIPEVLPAIYSLEQNYPNPFNPTTTIKFSIANAERVEIMVYNIKGEIVSRVVNADFKAGFHSVNFDGSSLASGQYFYKITAGQFSDIKKMIMVK